MSWDVVWDPVAVDLATRFLADDADGLRRLMAAIDSLGDDPTPPAAFQLGSSSLYRLRVGRYRAVYEVNDGSSVIQIRHIGRG